ncbi:MAG TPA: hypothetical protein PLH57_00845, partial [Oligoflexia bacterium]|nr:hypothetical protein [Oligoflexia bacterium]
DQYDTRRFILVDPLGNTVHPNTTAYWTMDGRLCDGQNGNPPYDPLKPETCPFITNVRFAAYCNAGDTAGTRCSIARAFKFYYTVEMTTAKISGVAPLPRYDSLINDPIYYTLGELLRMSIALPSDCDYANGYAITGFNADGTLQCGKVSAQVTPLAIHSFTSSQPSCQFSVRKSGATSDVTMEFPSLLPPSQGFHYVSFGGVWMEQNTGTAMDLGKPESCTTNYDPAAYYYSIGTEHFQNSYMISQCNGSGNSSNLQCTAKNDGMFSMWLAALNTSIPNDSMLRSAGMMANNMSHCNVCEIPGPLLVVHDFNEVHSDVAPNCPSGWDRLYTGRSLGGFSLDANDNDAGYAAMTDLSSPGSCVRLPSGFTHHRTPFIECKHFSTGSGDSERIGCSYDTGSDYSLWFTRSGGQAYQCSVCYKPAQMMVQ